MLLRRLRQRAGRPNLQCAGTSATIATGGDRATRRAQIAEVGSRLFGVSVASDHVIDETLERVAQVPVPDHREALRSCRRDAAAGGGSRLGRRTPARRMGGGDLRAASRRMAVWSGGRRFPLPTGMAALADATVDSPSVARRR